MISSLRGTVLQASGGLLVLEVGGVGFAVQVTPEHGLSLRLGQEALVLTSLVVREDALTLFGFADSERLALFELLTSVSGVGPKSALGVLATLSPEQIAAAVAEDDDAAFRKVSGIGPKTAKLIVVSLSGKVAPPRAAAPARQKGGSSLVENVVVALVGLGWPERVATDTVNEVIGSSSESERGSVPALLRLALARLGPARTSTPGGGKA